MDNITVKDKLLSIVKNIVERPKLFIKGDSFFDIADYLTGIFEGASLINNKSNWIYIQQWYGEKIAFTSSLIWYYHIYNAAKDDEEEAKRMLVDIVVRYVNDLSGKVDALNDETIYFGCDGQK